MKKILVLLLILVAFSGWAADRPVKLWGYGNWFELNPKDWQGAKDMPTTFNDWLSKKFGFTVEYAGPVPKGQSWSQALASYIGANGLPDVIMGAPGGPETTAVFLDFIKNNKLADLTKYFNDAKNYPLFSSSDKDYLRAYMVNGKVMALPGGGWKMKKDDPYTGGPNWIIRYDLMKKYGAPKTIPELTAFLKAVKNDPSAVDLDGKPVAPLMFGTVTDWPGGYSAILEQAFGAGWNITKSGKLMPTWASEEFGKGLSYLNQLYRDGLLDSRSLSNDGPWLDAFLRRGSVAIGTGGASVARYRGETLVAGVKEIGNKDDERAKKLINMQPVMLVPPVADNPGRLTSYIAGSVFFSKDTPNLDKVMKFAEFLCTGEGMIMFMAGAGFLNEGWEWVDYPTGPIYWQNKNKEPGNRDLNVTFPWGSTINALGNITGPSGSSYYEWMYYNKFVLVQRLGQFGVKLGGHANDDATALEWSKEYAGAINPLTKPIPSWLQFQYNAPTAETTAFVTAQQRLNEWMPKVLLSNTASAFIDNYGKMMDALVNAAVWKDIYANRQKEYESWLKANKFDDRKGMPFNTPTRWWNDKLGYIVGIY